MAADQNEYTLLLGSNTSTFHRRGNSRMSELQHERVDSILSSHIFEDEQLLGSTAIGERLPYNDCTTIDWLHDLVCNCPYPSDGKQLSSTDQRPLSISEDPLEKGLTVSDILYMGLIPRMDCCCVNWHIHSSCGFSCRYRRSHH